MIKSMGATELSVYLYPRVIAIHNMSEKDGFTGENGHLRIPRSLLASFSSIEEGGAYLVDNGQICVLWIHSLVSQNLLVDLFGGDYTELKSLDPHLSSLPVLQTQLNAQVRNILQYLATLRGSKGLTIQLARQGLDGAEHEFARLLVEDRNNEAQSYVDWLVHVHRHIQLEVCLSPLRPSLSSSCLLRAPIFLLLPSSPSLPFSGPFCALVAHSTFIPLLLFLSFYYFVCASDHLMTLLGACIADVMFSSSHPPCSSRVSVGTTTAPRPRALLRWLAWQGCVRPTGESKSQDEKARRTTVVGNNQGGERGTLRISFFSTENEENLRRLVSRRIIHDK